MIINKKTKIALSIAGILTTTTLLSTSNVNAMLQSNKGVEILRNTNVSDFHYYIRSMEAEGRVLGLTATIDSNGTETSDSNDLDCHMAKNTEWGAVAMLSYSRYGANQKVTGAYHTVAGESVSTNGNTSGIYDMVNGNYVAGVLNTGNGNTTKLTMQSQRYWNQYTSEVMAEGYIPGDATYETQWIQSGSWLTSSNPVFVRGNYYSNNNMSPFYHNIHNGNVYVSYGSRAVIVSGAGL